MLVDLDKVCEYARRVYGKAWFGEEREKDFRENMEKIMQEEEKEDEN